MLFSLQSQDGGALAHHEAVPTGVERARHPAARQGAHPPEGWYVAASRLGTLYFYLHFLVVLPLLALFALAAWFVSGVHVAGFWGAVVGALAVSVVGFAVHMLTGEKLT